MTIVAPKYYSYQKIQGILQFKVYHNILGYSTLTPSRDKRPNVVDVSDVATLIYSSDLNRKILVLHNVGSNDCYCGNSDVDTSSKFGFIIYPKQRVVITGDIGELYGICETGLTTKISVMEML